MTSIAKHVDHVLGRKDEAEILKLKTMFGLEQLEHNDDFASYVALLLPSQRLFLYECTYAVVVVPDLGIALVLLFCLCRLLLFLPLFFIVTVMQCYMTNAPSPEVQAPIIITTDARSADITATVLLDSR